MRTRECFDGDAVVRIDPHLVAGLELLFQKPVAALDDGGLHAVLGAHAQAVGAEHFGDLHHRPRLVVAEIADDHERLVHQHPRAAAQARHVETRVDVAVVVRAADHDLRGLLRGAGEECPDAVRGRGDLLHDRLQLLDRGARLAHRVLVLGEVHAELEQFSALRVARRERCDETVDAFERGERPVGEGGVECVFHRAAQHTPARRARKSPLRSGAKNRAQPHGCARWKSAGGGLTSRLSAPSPPSRSRPRASSASAATSRRMPSAQGPSATSRRSRKSSRSSSPPCRCP